MESRLSPALRAPRLQALPDFAEVSMAAFATSDVWDFRRDESGRWAWRRQSLFGEVLLEGRLNFGELGECLTDAQRHGYATLAPIDTGPGPVKRRPIRSVQGNAHQTRQGRSTAR